MSSLSNIRNQLRAVENIKKITTSMEMVASARFRRAHDRAKQAQFYIAKLQEILEKISAASPDFIHPLFIQRSVKKIGVVVVSSDRGLCGAYNLNVLAQADQFLKDKSFQEIELILLGRKSIQHFSKKNFSVHHQLAPWSGKITMEGIKSLSSQLVQDFMSKTLDLIWLVYTKFHSLMHREVVIEKFLPIGKLQKTKSLFNYIFEPNIEELYNQILPRFCMTKIETMLNEAYASELAARIFAMKAASKNAEEMQERLTLERNKLRQLGITRELLETTSAMREQ